MKRDEQRMQEVGHRPLIGIMPSLRPDDGALHVAGRYENAIAAMGGAPVMPRSSMTSRSFARSCP